MFDRCHRSWAAATFVKYERDIMYFGDVTPTPDDVIQNGRRDVT